MAFFLYTFLALVAGIHVACYGAYKDTPYENFIPRRAVREMMVAFFVAMVIVVLFDHHMITQRVFTRLAIIIIFSRIITEVYKLFIRREDQSRYLIPSQVHIFKKIIQNPWQRLVMAIIVPLFLGLGLTVSFRIYTIAWPNAFKGFMIGLIAGTITALGGGYKDGFFEGFDPIKFFRSPIVTGLAAAFIAEKSQNPVLIFFAAMGFERMIVEFYKGFVKSGYVPGKFRFKKPVYPQWVEKRKIFIFPYALTWLIVFSLIVYDI